MVHAHETGRRHPAFSETSFVRTVTAGVDPAGNKLSVAMPTYRMPLQDMSDLLAYLKRIETDLDPGVSETSIVIGTLLPDKTALTGLAQAMEDVLQAYFAEVNSRGGIYNRKIELRLMYGDTTSTLTNMKHLIDDEQVFAIVSGLTAGLKRVLRRLVRRKKCPSSVLPRCYRREDCRLTATFFYLLAWSQRTSKNTGKFCCQENGSPKIASGHHMSDADFSRGIAKSIEDQSKKLGWTTITRIYYPRDRFNPSQYVTELKQQGIDTVFHLGSGAETGALFKDAEAAGWSPAVYLLGTLVGRNITELVPVKMKDKVFLAFPTIPADISASGAAEYSALLQKNKLSSTHAAAQASAIAAARILVHGLELSGRT
jgi:ABC-type branched-subunit amino acid transport system substrate-binding protein